MFSIIISAAADAQLLKRTLQSVARDPKRPYEILAADDRSAKEARALLAQYHVRAMETGGVRGEQKHEGARQAAHPWLLFLHPGVVLDKNWRQEIEAFMASPKADERVGYFSYAIDDTASGARILERLAALGNRVWLAGGAQGLLIHKDFYAFLGGFPPLSLCEDLALLRAIRRRGRWRLHRFKTRALESPQSYRRNGYYREAMRRFSPHYLYALGFEPGTIQRFAKRLGR